jgi:hypothetical protein
MDLSKLSTKDLEYLKAGQITKVSTAGLEEMAKQQGSTGVLQPSVVAPVPYSPTAERVRAAAGGVTFSLADELEAAVRSGAVSGEEYRRIRDQLRAQQSQYALDRPVESTVSEVTGALAMPAALAVKPVTRGAGVLGDIALGTGTGALYGVGKAQEAVDIPEEAIKNALLGGGISGALSGAARLAAPAISGGIAFAYSGSGFSGSATYSSATNANAQLYRAISASANFYLNSQESITSDYVFVRPRSTEFNYSENPSFISGSTGEVLYSNFINNPQVYITTIGLYNDTNQLLAVAKLSRPLLKDFTKEALVRVKLDF